MEQNGVKVQKITPIRVAIKRMIPVIQARVVLTNITSWIVVLILASSTNQRGVNRGLNITVNPFPAFGDDDPEK